MRLRLVLTALVVAALALRLVFVVIDPHPFRQAQDALTQGGVARAILDGGRWGDEDVGPHLQPLQVKRHRLIDFSDPVVRNAPHHYGPLVLHPQGVGIVLAGVWAVTGQRDYIYMTLLQVILASLCTLLVFWIGRELYSERAGLIAAGTYALFVPLAEFSRYVFYDSWAVPWTIAITALVLKTAKSARPWPWLIATGLATGAAANFRFQLILLLPALALALLPRIGWRRALTAAAASLACACVLIVPWTIRNAHVYHTFVPLQTGFGQVLWQGFGDRANNPFGVTDNDGVEYAKVHRVRPDLVYATPAYDNYLRHKAFHAIGEKPLWYAGLVGERIVRATILAKNTNWIGPKRQDAFLHRTQSIPAWVVNHLGTAILLAFAGLMQPVLVLIALITLALTWRREWRVHLVPLAVIAATLLTPVLLNNTWRYTAGALFAWMLIAGHGLSKVHR